MSRLSQSVLSALLALLLLAATLVSVSHTLHQALHSDGATGSHICLACTFAKGQINAATVALVSAFIVFTCLWGARQPNVSAVSAFHYRFSPSRAPPVL